MIEYLAPNGQFNPVSLLCLCIATVCIGFSSGGLPGAASLGGPVLAFDNDFLMAQKLVAFLLVLSQMWSPLLHWKSISWRELATVFFNACIGIALAWMFLKVWMDTPQLALIKQGLRFTSGVVVLLLACNIYWTRVKERGDVPKIRGLIAWALCIVAGFLTTLANVAGPLVAWFLQARGMKKENLVGTVATCFLLVNLVKFLPYYELGLYDGFGLQQLREEWHIWAALFLLLLVAMALGKWWVHRTEPRVFFAVLAVIMFGVALSLIAKATVQLVA
jgi:hypothetical protein